MLAPRARVRLAGLVSLSFALATPASANAPNQHGKVVLFPFHSDDDAISNHVERLLRAHGLDIMTGVRPVDSAEQYRDMATQLTLVGYVEGSVRGTGAKARVTVRLRSGYSGRIVTQPTFGHSGGNLRRELGEKLWEKLGPAVTRICKEATKPRKRSRTMLTIDAGTPIETTPPEQPKSSTTSATTWVDPFAE
jgi:hypothetical protein